LAGFEAISFGRFSPDPRGMTVCPLQDAPMLHSADDAHGW
jgi:hypothetical protein